MNFPQHIWNQLKNKSADDLISALKRDKWLLDETRGAQQIYRQSDGRRVSIHYHPNKNYGPKLLKSLLNDINWTENDLRQLKLIK